MRQACFDYLRLGGMYSSGPVSLLSGLNPRPSVLVMHFFMVAIYGVSVCALLRGALANIGQNRRHFFMRLLMATSAGWTVVDAATHAASIVDRHDAAVCGRMHHTAHHLRGGHSCRVCAMPRAAATCKGRLGPIADKGRLTAGRETSRCECVCMRKLKDGGAATTTQFSVTLKKWRLSNSPLFTSLACLAKGSSTSLYTSADHGLPAAGTNDSRRLTTNERGADPKTWRIYTLVDKQDFQAHHAHLRAVPSYV